MRLLRNAEISARATESSHLLEGGLVEIIFLGQMFLSGRFKVSSKMLEIVSSKVGLNGVIRLSKIFIEHKSSSVTCPEA